jgi:PAS domain S-box-containing protein
MHPLPPSAPSTQPSGAAPGFEFAALFESSLDGVLLIDAEGRIADANPAACRMFGMGAPLLTAIARAVDLFACSDRRVQAFVGDYRAAGRASGRATALAADGTPFDVQLRAMRCDSGQTVLVLRDLDPCGQPRARAKSSRPRGKEAANAELQAVALGLAQDLCSPINAVTGFGRALERLLAREEAPAGALHYVRRMLAAADHLGEYVEALTSLARVSEAPVPGCGIDLSAIALRIARELAVRHPARAVQAQVQPGLRADGDPVLLRLLLENLLGNAWKFTGRRPGAAVAFTAQSGDAGETVFCVRDNGTGFDMAYADKLFQDFQRLHSHAEFPGAGVGLANVRRIAERHGGRVWAHSEPGQGAAFFFTLPGGCAVAADEGEARADSAPGLATA